MTEPAAALDDGAWAAPHPEPRRRRAREIAAAVAIAAVIGGLGGAAIHAARSHAHFPGPFMVDMSGVGAPERGHAGGAAIS